MTEAEVTRCFSCGARVPDIEGPVHRYLDSSPGCWAVYGEVLAREYSQVLYARNHRLTVDAYAVQHPGKPSPQSIQSVALHLASLHLVFARGAAPGEATALMQRMARNKSHLSWLEPPSDRGEVTVADVRAAGDAESHLRKVEEWAESAWTTWADHHDQVRAWVERWG